MAESVFKTADYFMERLNHFNIPFTSHRNEELNFVAIDTKDYKFLVCTHKYPAGSDCVIEITNLKTLRYGGVYLTEGEAGGKEEVVKDILYRYFNIKKRDQI